MHWSQVLYKKKRMRRFTTKVQTKQEIYSMSRINQKECKNGGDQQKAGREKGGSVHIGKQKQKKVSIGLRKGKLALTVNTY